MKLTTHPFMSDTLTLTKEDLKLLADGNTLQASALTIKLEKKPDQVVYPATAGYRDERGFSMTVSTRDQLKLTFDGDTGKLKSAEVL
jgi:hypothetical protein